MFISLLSANSRYVFLDTPLQSMEMLTHLSLIRLCFPLTVSTLHVMVTRVEALKRELVTGFLQRTVEGDPLLQEAILRRAIKVDYWHASIVIYISFFHLFLSTRCQSIPTPTKAMARRP